jgi:class 3 adenylate cyclase
VFSWHAAPIVPSFAIRYPDLASKLVLFNPAAPVTVADNEWVAEAMGVSERILSGGQHDDRYQGIPGRVNDPAFNAWNEAAGRVGASPAQAERMTRATFAAPFPDLAHVRIPTLVLTRTPTDYYIPAEYFQRAAAAIPDAQLEILPHGDSVAVGIGVDDLLTAVGEFIAGEIRLPAPERQLTTILFTDLVESTRRAATDGDAEWKRVLDRHDAVNSREVRSRGGEVIKSTGDGVLALLPSASAAVEAAQAIRSGLAADGLEVRVGLHIGEVDRRGDDVSGLAVNMGARIMAMAEAGQILASALVSQVVDPSTFASIGSLALKGFDGDHELFVLT